MTTLSDAQQLVDNDSERILITAADAHGHLRLFATRSSVTALSKKPEGWRKSRLHGPRGIFILEAEEG